MSDYVLEARQVTKTLGRGAREVQALRGIDLSLRRGELTLLMGPSGSGKTTLLLILGCMLAPSSGSVAVCGTSTSGVDKEGLAKLRRDHIGFVFQSYHLFPTMTAMQNVQLALDIRGERGRKARQKAREALDLVGLGQKVKSRPGELSGGEQQRVAIARALVMQPDVLLADEPTGDLDEHTADTLHELLSEMHRERGLTSIIATHNPRLAAACHRVLRLEDGRLKEETRLSG
jgi:putative ABC transport system ATP-binding protein